ncbi:Peptidase M10 serralysin Matrixin like protein [Bradyrhizobium sp. YR681]|uniref:FG-GAP-like repeat-containing protein n=1 Tax=Bradyrhizobium sp. YR681 TaxID=1144344 RepID=UPI000271413F|nr:FG-GAP-like repeat-containing protein [Bradyrhizobium sp. YR681]EJN12861.1 Peptidase M10 serralysin Matrixin like protein [Bradyrhizobium sp. YR681]
MATSVTVSATNNAEIDGLLAGTKWSGTITYSFPDASSDYSNPYSGGSSEPTTTGFASAPTAMQAAINYAIGLILNYTNATIQYNGTGSANVMIAQSPSANPTSYAYYPGNYAAGGDVWFGTHYNYSLAQLGNYYFTTALHELGHAFGLKHSQETGGVANVAVPSAHDDSEYTVMSYRSYVGASTSTGYTNEAYGYPQTYMANDILAFQTLYGANYTYQSGTTVYTWSQTTGQEFINGVAQLAPGGGAGGSANRIYETVWDGGGVDTYDLSNYTTSLSINLNPGASSLFSSVQLANLGNGHYASGNVYNAYLYNNDVRSYIDNAIGGSGNDTILGNAIANVLNGGSGDDTLTGGGGNDAIIGGSGNDTVVYSGNEANYVIVYNSATQTFTISDQRSGTPDGTDTITGVEYFQFADGTVTNATLAAAFAASHTATREPDFNGDGKTDLLFLNDTTHGVTVWDMNGTQVLDNTQVGTSSTGSHYAAKGDFNGDGKADLLFLNDTTHELSAMLMNGSQSVAPAVVGVINAAGGWQFTDVGDFNGDGKADLLFVNSTTNGIAEWQLNGTQIVVGPQVGVAPSGFHFASTGDFNGDGKTDLLLINDTTHDVQMWQMNGTQVSSATTIGTVNAAGGWHFAATGDFNGDGKTDLFFINDTTHGAAIWLMNGSQITASPQIGTINTAGGWQFTDVGDFNGDGKSDLLFLNSTTRGVAVWQLNGTQIIDGPQVGIAASGDIYAGLQDIDGDHKSDILFENATTHALTVWEMNGTQVALNQQIGTTNAANGWHLVT